MIREKAIDHVRRDRQKDIDDFVKMLCKPSVQATIGRYLEGLKARRK